MSSLSSQEKKKASSNVAPTGSRRNGVTAFQFYHGMLIASFFSLIYIFSPLYILTSVAALLMQYPSRKFSVIYGAPLIISLFTKAKCMPSLGEPMKALLNYFDYDEVHECSNEELRESLKKKKEIYFCFATSRSDFLCFFLFLGEYTKRVPSSKNRSCIRSSEPPHSKECYGYIQSYRRFWEKCEAYFTRG